MVQGYTRRSLLVGSIAAAVLTVPAASLAQQKYPSQDIHVICAFPPGSGADIVVRFFGEKLRQKSGGLVLVENKVGAAGNIAAEYTARAKPDGYTIHIHAGSSVAANMHLFKHPPIDAGKELQVVATVNQQPFMVMVPANSPYQTLAELT